MPSDLGQALPMPVPETPRLQKKVWCESVKDVFLNQSGVLLSPVEFKSWIGLRKPKIAACIAVINTVLYF